jgi:hypothetical protein
MWDNSNFYWDMCVPKLLCSFCGASINKGFYLLDYDKYLCPMSEYVTTSVSLMVAYYLDG